MGDAEADPEVLSGGEEWRLSGGGERKKLNFSLTMACFGEFRAVFFENLGGQFALASPTPNFVGLVPHHRADLRPQFRGKYFRNATDDNVLRWDV